MTLVDVLAVYTLRILVRCRCTRLLCQAGRMKAETTYGTRRELGARAVTTSARGSIGGSFTSLVGLNSPLLFFISNMNIDIVSMIQLAISTLHLLASFEPVRQRYPFPHFCIIYLITRPKNAPEGSINKSLLTRSTYALWKLMHASGFTPDSLRSSSILYNFSPWQSAVSWTGIYHCILNVMSRHSKPEGTIHLKR